MDHSLKMNKTKVGKEGVLSLMGNLTMAEAREIKEILLDAINEIDTLYLDLGGVASVDVSFIQLLCAAHRECFLSQKKIFLQGHIPGTMETFLETAGYLKQCGCLPNAPKSCLWSTCNTDQ